MNLCGAARHQRSGTAGAGEGVIATAWRGEPITELAPGRLPPAGRHPTAHAPAIPTDVASFSLFGIALSVRSNDAAVLAALASYCDRPTAPARIGGPPLDLSLVVDPSLTGTAMAPLLIDGPCLAIDGPGLVGRADARRGHGSCRLSAALRDDAEALRERVLDPLLLFLVARRGRTPLHAAGFLADGLAVLLAGPSGAGKSCLTLAACRAGFAPLSDDMVFVERGARPGVWGLPGAIHLFARDAPESDQVIRLRNGKHKRAVVPVGARAPRRAKSAVLCLLRFGDAVGLEPVDPGEAMRAFAVLEPGFDLLAADIAIAVAELARRGAWVLTLSDRPDEALALLADNLPLLRGER